ncbi:MAG TPA: triple tyrosine motif-containing protein [Chitinophagaceae bacterium]|nr:triple tyrosine motif-containing protein [Chitinophagaceae bacterium]
MMKSAAFILLLLAWTDVWGQNTIALPDIVNYSKQTTKAGAQNRQIRQDKKGLLYFANNEGVLTFDGINWKVYPLPNKSIVRALEFGPDDKLYVGGQDEFGYFSPGRTGTLEYHSMRHLLPEAERSFTDVWEIIFYRDWIFFQTSNKIFQLNENHCTVYKSPHWKFMAQYGDRLIAQDYEKGLLSFQNGMWAPFLKINELPGEFFATSLTTIGKDSALLTTSKNGAYLLTADRATRMKTPFMDLVSTKNLSSATMVNDQHIAIATNLDGCYIIDKKGQLVQSFTRKEGLQNNNILDIYLDREKNLWLGLDNGIDFIAYNNAIKHIYPDYLNEGSGYAATIHNNELYIGTSNGLYKVPLYNEPDLSYIKGSFQPVANSKGQVWNLSEVNGKLLMGHNEGAFLVEDNTAHVIDNSSGFWTFQPFSNVLPSSLMVTGTYQGINFYNYANGRFTSKNVRAHFESARFVVIENNNIYVAHPYKGIYRVQLNGTTPVIKYYTHKEGVLSVNGNYLFKIRNRIILTTEENGIYEYNASKDGFEPSSYYNNLFGKKAIRYLKEDALGNVWFVFDKILGVVDMSAQKPQIIYFPELTNKFVSGFEFINPIDNHNVLIGGERGFYHINYEQYKKIKFPLHAQITMVKAFNATDSLLFGGYVHAVNEGMNVVQERKPSISHAWNSFHFSFAAPVYGQQSNIEYSYILEGFEKNWSDFSRRTEKEYTNLPAGSYSFKVKARNNLGNESPVTSYAFTVLPPWYQTWWAYTVYFALFICGVYLLYRMQKKKFREQQRRHEEEQKQLQYLHQLEIEKAEAELIALRNAKLEAEIQHKNTELASAAMHLVQKGELLGKVKEQMLRLKKVTGDDKDSEDFKKLIRIINEEDKMDEQWEQFAMHFDKVHSDFLLAVKAKYPKLSANELKLCAYLRMNLTTKEIAQLMNISVRGVEISRYRLRKKLQVPTEANLFNFLMEVTQHPKEN